jgi:excisionase family DNA binding protein
VNDTLPQVAPMLLKAKAAADTLSISERTLFRYVKDGAIPAVHIGACVRFDPRDLAAFIDRLKAPEEARL